ncbi:MAG: ATP-binding protein [Desulfobacterales bacterium]|nr:ATP-binding protein [Desulfobacterales bacterium]
MIKQTRIKTPRDAKGSESLKILEKTTTSVFQSRIAPKSAENMKHCHALKASRNIRRIDRRPWENRVGQMLKIVEQHRYDKVNALYHALARVNGLLAQARGRETKLKDLTRELSQTGTYLQTLMDAMVDMLLATDRSGVIVEANLASQRISGFSAEELVGSAFQGFFTDPEKAKLGLLKVREKSEIMDYELTLIRKDGIRVPIMCNASLLYEEDAVSGVLINARDVSELKQARDTQEKYARELARANEDLEIFASLASHELKEPLKKVGDYAEDLVDKYAALFDDSARKDLKFLVDQTDYMQELVKSVLDYARVDEGDRIPEPADCEQVLDQALSNLAGSIGESPVRIIREPLPVVTGESEQLVRLFQNLLGNAIKYFDPEKTEKFVRVSAARIGDAGVKIPETSLSEGWIIKVEDNGIGIDKEFQADIFKLFIRLHSDDEIPGQGMGLAIARKIIRRHNGDIWVVSNPGEGSTFYLTLPDWK